MQHLIDSRSADALEYATKKHAGVNRRGGAPYITHPETVAATVKRAKPGSHKLDDLVAAAYLHDTIEDTDATYEELLRLFGPNVTALVFELTSDEDELKRLGKTEYLKRKFAGISSWGLVIKLADRLSNIADLDEADVEWATKYAKQTKEVVEYLRDNRKLTGTQENLVAEISGIVSGYLNRH